MTIRQEYRIAYRKARLRTTTSLAILDSLRLLGSLPGCHVWINEAAKTNLFMREYGMSPFWYCQQWRTRSRDEWEISA